MPEKNRRQDASPSASPRMRRHQILDAGERADNVGIGSYDDGRFPPAADEPIEEYATVKLSAVRKEFQCPICLDVIQETRTVKECLHRFCRECIDKSIRLGKNECPTCRTHCASRRSLRDDPSFDSLIAAIYPITKRCKEDQEMTLHEEEKARNKQVQDSIAETLQRQSMASGRKRSAFTRETANYRDVKSRIDHETSEHKGSDGEGGKDLSSADNTMNFMIHPAHKDGIVAQSRLIPLEEVTRKLEEERRDLLKQGSTLSAVVTDLVEKAKSASNLILMNNRRLLHLENDSQHEDTREDMLRGIFGDGQSLVSMHQQKILELEKVVELQTAELEVAKVELKKNECQLELLQRDKEEIIKGHKVILDRALAEHATSLQASFNKGSAEGRKGRKASLETEQGKAALKVKIDEYLRSAEFKELMRAERQAGKDEAIRSPELYKLIVQVAVEMKCGAVTEAVNILAPMIPSFDMKNLPKNLLEFYDEGGALACYREAKKQVLDFGLVEVPDSDEEKDE